jgi:hypothetical protein
MDQRPFIPVSAIDLDWVGHDGFSICAADHRYTIHLVKRNSSGLNLAHCARAASPEGLPCSEISVAGRYNRHPGRFGRSQDLPD